MQQDLLATSNSAYISTETSNGAILPSKIEGNSADNQVIHHQEAALRNYASSECGAKVLLSNKEVENKVSCDYRLYQI